MKLRIPLLLLASMGAVFLIGACGGGGETKAAATPTPAPVQPQELIFTVDETGYGGPDSVEAGWVKLVLLNQGQQEHHMAVTRLSEGKTADDLAASIREQDVPWPLPVWAIPSGGPGIVVPGRSSNALLKLEQGNYALVHYVGDEIGTALPAIEMLRPLTVTAATGPLAPEPAPGILFEMNDFRFFVLSAAKSAVTSPIGARSAQGMTPVDGGPGTIIKVTNDGPQAHEARLVEFEPGKRTADYPGWELKSPPGSRLMRAQPTIAEDGTGPHRAAP